jgi:hypothetical protein
MWYTGKVVRLTNAGGVAEFEGVWWGELLAWIEGDF